MYFCLCNSLKDKDVTAAIENGAQCVSDVYKHNGCKPQCGKCVPYLRESLPCALDAGMAPIAQ
jgi:bacterioferritin-associated ferredoxin